MALAASYRFPARIDHTEIVSEESVVRSQKIPSVMNDAKWRELRLGILQSEETEEERRVMEGVLRKYHIPVEIRDGLYRIYGYANDTSNITFLK
jgi:hypothetical protein